MTELKKILHVDDEPDIREIVKLTLQEIGGYQVISCDSGQAALDQAEKFFPDLILMDVMMPEMDGPSTYKKMQTNENIKHFPVIFMTAKAQSHEIDEYLQLGGIGAIIKPFDPATLSDEIERIWEKHCDQKS